MIFRVDFHNHTDLSDGSEFELLLQTARNYGIILGVADHRSWQPRKNCISGIEVDAEFTSIEGMLSEAFLAKSLDVWPIIVHGGKKLVNDVVSRTTRLFNILAHPHLITEEQAESCARNNIYVELSGKWPYSKFNAHVAQVCMKANAKLLFNSDSHTLDELYPPEEAFNMCVEAGLSRQQAYEVCFENPIELMRSYYVC